MTVAWGWGHGGLVAGLRVWAGHLGSVTVFAAPGPLGHLTSTYDVGNNHIICVPII